MTSPGPKGCAAGWKRACIAVAAPTVLLSCAPAPPYVAPMETPKPVVSYVSIPMTIPLAVLERAADDQVRRSFEVAPYELTLAGGSAAPSCGVDVGYRIDRGPLRLSGTGTTLASSSELAYWIKGRKQLPCPGPEVTASCGTDGEAPRTARLTVDSEFAIQPDLTARIQSVSRPIQPGDRCEIRPFGLDVTDAVAAAFDARMREVLPAMDQRLSSMLDLGSRVRTAWGRMGEPREVRPGVWLAWNPEGVGVMPASIVDGSLRTGVQIRVRPVITAGAKPAPSVTPLPLAYNATQDDRFQLQIPVDVQESFLRDRLAQVLELDKGGKPFSAGNVNLRITGADVTGEGTQVQVTLQFAGDVNGTAILVGTPIFEAATRVLSFPDLDYTLDSDRFLLNSASFVAHGQIRDRLRQQFTVELGDRIDSMRAGLEALLNREEGNLRLRGTVDTLALLGISRPRDADVFTVFMAARGKVAMDVGNPPEPR